jgi:hypothetical protein
MKRFALAVIALLALAPAASHANSNLAVQVGVARIQAIAAVMGTNTNLINWKVGDTANYNLNAFNMDIGTMVESADHEEGNTIWLKEVMTITGLGQGEEVDAQIDRSNGQIVKMLLTI